MKVKSYHYDNASYEFTGTSIIEALFGYFDGALNAIPKGGFLSKCGLNLKAQRYQFLNLTQQIENRDLIKVVDHFYNLLGYTYNSTYYCYYGFASFLNQDNLTRLFTELDILKNLVFNIGYLYTDIVMISIGVPG